MVTHSICMKSLHSFGKLCFLLFIFVLFFLFMRVIQRKEHFKKGTRVICKRLLFCTEVGFLILIIKMEAWFPWAGPLHSSYPLRRWISLIDWGASLSLHVTKGQTRKQKPLYFFAFSCFRYFSLISFALQVCIIWLKYKALRIQRLQACFTVDSEPWTSPLTSWSPFFFLLRVFWGRNSIPPFAYESSSNYLSNKFSAASLQL